MWRTFTCPSDLCLEQKRGFSPGAAKVGWVVVAAMTMTAFRKIDRRMKEKANKRK